MFSGKTGEEQIPNMSGKVYSIKLKFQEEWINRSKHMKYVTLKKKKEKNLIFILIRYIVLRVMEIIQVEWDRVSKDLNNLMMS